MEQFNQLICRKDTVVHYGGVKKTSVSVFCEERQYRNNPDIGAVLLSLSTVTDISHP